MKPSLVLVASLLSTQHVILKVYQFALLLQIPSDHTYLEPLKSNYYYSENPSEFHIRLFSLHKTVSQSHYPAKNGPQLPGPLPMAQG